MSGGRTAKAGPMDKFAPARPEGGAAPAPEKSASSPLWGGGPGGGGALGAGMGKIGARAFWFAQCFTAKIW